MASEFLTAFYAALETVSAGSAGDPAVAAKVEELNTLLTANTATDAEQSEAILALTNKLAASTPAPAPEPMPDAPIA